ncbi:MAG: hypothetical protein ABSH28_02295 [Acidobacteriota bacterium]
MPLYSDAHSYYRAMMPDVDGLPKAGQSARMLGIRVPKDIVLDENGFVRPGTGGMSVAPNSPWNVPNHRRPRGMRMGSTGKYNDRMYALADTAIPADKLNVRPDPLQPYMHAFVEPAVTVELARYETDLANTRRDWRQVWP